MKKTQVLILMAVIVVVILISYGYKVHKDNLVRQQFWALDHKIAQDLENSRKEVQKSRENGIKTMQRLDDMDRADIARQQLQELQKINEKLNRK